VRQGKRVAKAMARSWVLSAISARTTKANEVRKAVMEKDDTRSGGLLPM